MPNTALDKRTEKRAQVRLELSSWVLDMQRTENVHNQWLKFLSGPELATFNILCLSQTLKQLQTSFVRSLIQIPQFPFQQLYFRSYKNTPFTKKPATLAGSTVLSFTETWKCYWGSFPGDKEHFISHVRNPLSPAIKAGLTGPRGNQQPSSEKGRVAWMSGLGYKEYKRVFSGKKIKTH